MLGLLYIFTFIENHLAQNKDKTLTWVCFKCIYAFLNMHFWCYSIWYDWDCFRKEGSTSSCSPCWDSLCWDCSISLLLLKTILHKIKIKLSPGYVLNVFTLFWICIFGVTAFDMIGIVSERRVLPAAVFLIGIVYAGIALYLYFYWKLF